MTLRRTTTCCIIGGGPAGIMLGYLLARSGVKVVVLEKHKDFFRDFRGDTIHPSTLEVIRELGLLERLLDIPHTRLTKASVNIGGEEFVLADLKQLPTYAKFVALMPQWDFLSFLASEAQQFPSFTLLMEHTAKDLLLEEGTVTGVLAESPSGPVEITAKLTVGCDGRHALSRDAAHLSTIEDGVPIDVLWMRISRLSSDPQNGLGYVNYGRLVVLIDRRDYYQVAYIIAKGAFPQIQTAGLQAFQQSLVRIAPFLDGRSHEIDSWEKVKLLTVQVNHLAHWASPGLLCIGDAAHAMSPIGGIGINIALQDSVAAANILTEALLTDTLTFHHLRRVQQYRERAVRMTQNFQVFAHAILDRVLRNPGEIRPPFFLRFLSVIPGFRYLTARFIGMGIQPQHVHTKPKVF